MFFTLIWVFLLLAAGVAYCQGNRVWAWRWMAGAFAYVIFSAVLTLIIGL
jgi:hypothetical protein